MAVAVIVLSAVAMIRALPVDAWIEWLRETTTSFGAWAPLGFVALFIGLTMVCLPGVPLNVLSGVIFGPLLGGALTVLASNLSAALSFLVGRLARKPLARVVRRFPKADAVYHTLGKKGSWKLVAGVRLSHALPFGIQNLLLGATPVSFGPYLLATVLVTLPGIFVIAYFGHLGAVALVPSEASEPLSIWRWLARAAGLAVAATAIIYLGAVARKAVQKQLDETRSNDKSAPRDRPSPSVGVTLTFAAVAGVFVVAAAWFHLAGD